MGGLKQVPVGLFGQSARDVKSLYHMAFPPEERPPYSLARLLACFQPGISFTAYYHDQVFVGFAITMKSSTAHFVFLFAISDQVRSQGYGSQILREIAEQAKGLPQVLCIELMDQSAANYDQRLKRLAFYEKNGYRRQYRHFHELNEVYEILATPGRVDYDQLEQDLNRLTLGLLRIKILPPTR